MNYMKQVAEMLGLEWDEEKLESEEFKINTISDANYKLICEHGCFEVRLERNKKWESTNYLNAILSGCVQIIKKSWKPRYSEQYYYVRLDESDNFSSSFWGNTQNDNHRYELGLIFKTKEEAIAKAEKIIKMLKESEAET